MFARSFDGEKIRVIFCDSKRSPMAELSPYYGAHDCSRKIKAQISWDTSVKQIVWSEIVAEKIKRQVELLLELEKNREAELLYSYVEQIALGDATNREGHAAKVYFNAVFGMSFTRSSECVTNAALNYGYSIILSAISREITSCGYLTQLGIFHDNMFNQFNLSCDLMESFGVFIDRHVYYSDFINFDINNKSLITKITSALEKASLDEENYLETQRLMGEIEVQLSKWAFEFPCDIVPTKINSLSLIKSAGIEIRNSYEGRFGDAEKLIDYMELVREFDCDKLFITVNMRAFFADDIVEKFIETVISNEIKLLMIENKSYSKLKGEKRYTIDEDLCEF